jgi:hypothetical protein
MVDAVADVEPIAKPERVRDADHLAFVRRQPCCKPGCTVRTGCDAHHVKFAQSRALGRKVSDAFAVPLCHTHHMELESVGDERILWSWAGVDAVALAMSLWRQSHGLAA